MSKTTIDGLTQSGTGCFIAVPIWRQSVSKGYLPSQAIMLRLSPAFSGSNAQFQINHKVKHLSKPRSTISCTCHSSENTFLVCFNLLTPSSRNSYTAGTISHILQMLKTHLTKTYSSTGYFPVNLGQLFTLASSSTALCVLFQLFQTFSFIQDLFFASHL